MGHTHRHQFGFKKKKKKKNQVKSPSPESRVPETGLDPPIRSGRGSGRDTLYKPMPLHQRHKQLPTLHGTVVGSGAGSGLEHPDLGISKFSPPPHFLFLICLV